MPRINAFAQQVDIWNSNLQGEVRRQLLVDTAYAARDAALAQDRAILGREPPYVTVVDGRPGASESSVRPGGTIVYLFNVGGASLEKAVDAAYRLLLELSPVKTGQYQSHHIMLVNGQQAAVAAGAEALKLSDTDVVSFVNLLPYSRKIERGLSSMAPDGVYETAQTALKATFGNLLNIGFSYDRYPGFGVGSARRGGRPTTKSDTRRSEQYPTLTLRAK